MEYTREQLNTLKELQKILFENGFEIRDILARYRKHPLEFVAIKKEWEPFDSTIVRLFRGKIRICFLEFKNAWTQDIFKRVSALSGKPDLAPICFAKTYRNDPQFCFKSRSWKEFVYKRDLKKTGLEGAVQQLKNAGIIIKKGSRAL